MITRDVGQARAIAAFKSLSFDASCGSLNGDSTTNLLQGFVIDRLGLGRGYSSVLVEAHVDADIGTSTAADGKFVAISAQLWHASTTCAGDLSLFSTQGLVRQPAFVFNGPNTTSTLASGYMATSTSVGTFGTWTATATGFGRASFAVPYSLAGAHRYLSVHVLPEAYSSSSGGSALRVSASLIFGEPDDVIVQPTTSTGGISASTGPTAIWKA